MGRRLALGSVFLTLWVCLVVPKLAAAEEEEAVRIYRQLKPSVVSLQNAEGSGTGILVGTDGLILTNAHVIASPLPYTVRVDADGSAKQMTFKKVKVVGFHPKLDLALIRIDPAENNAKLHPATIVKSKGETGQRVYVIGDPAGGGTVLSKSITSGMLSAVDREIEGGHYYQLGAAINPGNSGGPVVDASGNVLGVVTFKFTDAEAIGFAIPIDDVDLNAFVPLTKRKVDTARADKLLDIAEKYGNRAEQIGRTRGNEDPERMMLNYYALTCYRLALIEDPGRPSTYYNVGMLLRALDEDAAGVAYLGRAVRMEPWDVNDGTPYRELGLALAKTKQIDKALAAWNEGLAKFPYSGKLWEDLAITHIQAGRYAEAARCAAMAAMVGDKFVRLETVRNIRRDAIGKLDEEERAKVAQETLPAPLATSLETMRLASNEARKARTVFITQAFRDTIDEIGGPEVSDVAHTIPQKPQETPQAVAHWLNPGAIAAADGKASKPPSKASGKKKPSDSKNPPAKPDTVATNPKPPVKPAGDDWLGSDSVGSGSGSTANLPKPKVTGTSLADKPKKVVDATFVSLRTTGVVAAEWSGDGNFAFVLEKKGLVRKVAVPELKEERQIDLASECTALARTAEGLAVAVSGLQEVWLLDEDLNIKSRIKVSGLKVLAGSPASSVAYGGSEQLLSIIDLKAGKVVDQVKEGSLVKESDSENGRADVRFFFLAASPDGQYLFCEGDECLCRLRIDGMTLAYEESGPRIGSNVQSIVVSPDSRYVAMPSGGGNSQIEGQPKLPYATYIFKVGDISHPVITIDSGAYPRAIGFDLGAKAIYAQNYEKQLMVFSPKGLRGGEYAIRDGGETEWFLVHPSGKKLLLLAHALSWVTLP